ncbi:unnamed protein product [Clonostachys byssicola]|uniref:Zn(2)-C6 fungal-type domain-containing protein n=1 Tax=Clonostachys byssicola TaxID=160290 RepID=A0A9N9UGU1_9HYPO|nr:unnamed protein product [Clonostachys byssicola]
MTILSIQAANGAIILRELSKTLKRDGTDGVKTINACNRCRKRKAKCDTGIPACSQCQSSGSSCDYTDARSKTTHPRTYISDLEDQVSQLESRIRALGKGKDDEAPSNRSRLPSTAAEVNAEADDRERPDFIRLELGDDSHFLGTSSGMHLARSVLESTRKNSTSFDSHNSRPESNHHGQSPHYEGNLGHDTRDENPLPSLETASSLIEIFFCQYQIQYPILDQQEFMDHVSKLYATDKQEYRSILAEEPWTRFMLNIVLSISLLLLSHDNSDSLVLAERFRMDANAELGSVMRRKTHRTLQCLLLLLLSSIVSSKSAPVWYISGLCMRMCVDLGFHSEQTIKYGLDENDGPDEELQDMKRRLFWVTYTFDRSLATMLGRPFFLDDDDIDVEYPSRSLPQSKRSQVLHWFRMQRIQSEIVYRLHTSKGPHSSSTDENSDIATWKAMMAAKLLSWQDESMKLIDNENHSMDWWRYWYQNANLMLHRPLSHGPLPSSESLLAAYDSAKSMVHLSFIRVYKGPSEFTWLDLHYQLMSGLTLLFLVLKSPDARRKAQTDWASFKSCTIEWQVVLEKLTGRWVQMARTKEALVRLVEAAVDTIEESSSGQRSKRGGNRIMRDRRYRDSIMQELGSPGTSSSIHNATSLSPENADSSQPRMAIDERLWGVKDHSTRGSQVHRHRSSHEEHGCSPTYGTHAQPEPVSVSTWSDSQIQPEDPMFTPLFDNLDLSSMLDGDVWSGLNTFDVSPQTQFGLFDQYPLPMLGVETFGLPMMGSGSGRLDTTLTESVLNFQGNMEEARQVD